MWTNTHSCSHSHHALSLNEIGAVPGGAFKAFWDPVYKISISTKKKRIFYIETSHRISAHVFSSTVHHSLCWSIKSGAAPSDATESTKSRQLYLYKRKPR